MPDLNKTLKTASSLQKKLLEDLVTLNKMYDDAASEINGRFRDEYQRNSGNMNGLEDFFMLNTIVKKNGMSIRNALNLVKRMKNVEGFEISEENLEDAELEEILNS